MNILNWFGKVEVDKEEVSKILTELKDLDYSSAVIKETGKLDLEKLNLLPRILTTKEELRSLGVDMEYLRLNFYLASLIIKV